MSLGPAPALLVGPAARRVRRVKMEVTLLSGVLEQLITLRHHIPQGRAVSPEQRRRLYLVSATE